MSEDARFRDAWGSIFDLGSGEPPAAPQSAQEPTEPAERIIGFRYFRVAHARVKLESGDGIQIGNSYISIKQPTSDAYLLQSYSANYIWRPGWNTAICEAIPSTHSDPLHRRVPHERSGMCSGMCGLWACTDVKQLTRLVGRPHEMVLCGVQAAGKVVECDKGWRAEKARIVAITAKIPGRIILNTQGQIKRVESAQGFVDPEIIATIASFYNLKKISLQHIQDQLRQITDGRND